jgi:hypothetical protein
MSVLRNASCDRVATLLFAANGPVAFSRLVALTSLPEQTVATALRQLASDGVVVRAEIAGRPAWQINPSDPFVSVNRSLLAKMSAGSDLASLLRPIIATFPLITRAVLLDERPEATLVCVVSDPTTLDWDYGPLVAIQEAIDTTGRAVVIEPVGEEWFRAERTSAAVKRVRSPKAIILKGDH